jgi:hypothetical protein
VCWGQWICEVRVRFGDGCFLLESCSWASAGGGWWWYWLAELAELWGTCTRPWRGGGVSLPSRRARYPPYGACSGLGCFGEAIEVVRARRDASSGPRPDLEVGWPASILQAMKNQSQEGLHESACGLGTFPSSPFTEPGGRFQIDRLQSSGFHRLTSPSNTNANQTLSSTRHSTPPIRRVLFSQTHSKLVDSDII